MKKYLLILLVGAYAQAGEIGQDARTIEWYNWLVAHDVELTDSVKLFLYLPDEIPISDTTGLILPTAQFRTYTKDRMRGWVNQVVRRLHVAENSHPAYWVYHIETNQVFDLTRMEKK